MSFKIDHTVEIDADPATVWAVITDFDAYPEWNPFVVEASGRVEVGERLINRMQPPGGKAMTFKPTVTEVDPQRTFEWLGRLGIPRIFDGRHRFELHPTADGGTRLQHSEYFNGLLVRAMRTSLDTTTKAGFEAMNAALKTRAEALATATP